MQNKTITVSLKSFKYLGFLLISFGIMLILNQYFLINPSKNLITGNFFAGVTVGIFGLIFLLLGNKKRRIIFRENRIEYIVAKPIFTANYAEINLIKTFIDSTNKSENLMIFVDEQNLISFTNSFFPQEKLIEIYQELLFRCNEFIEKNKISIENELNW